MIFEEMVNKVHCADCLEFMKNIPDNSIDLIVTDPPYFRIMINEYNGEKHSWDNQWESFEEYLNFMRNVFNEFKRTLKQTGSLYIFQDDKNAAYCQIELDKLGFYFENNIVWVKPNNMPIKGWASFRSFAPITERILFYSKEQRNSNLGNLTEQQIECMKPIVEYMIENKKKIKAIFNFKTDEEFNIFINRITETSSVASRHYFTYSQFAFPTEEMYAKLQKINKIIKDEVFKKDYEDFKKDYEDLRRHFKQDKNYTDVWTYNITSSGEETFHPTQKPIDLIRRIIKVSSKENDLVLDPFFGSGTTAVASLMLNRRFIGIELSEEYCKIANARIKKWKEQTKLKEFQNRDLNSSKTNI